MTYIDIINKVLIRLRESQASSPTATEYSTLISEFVNEAKREVEDAWNWSALRTTIQIPTVQGTHSYSITGSGNRMRPQNVDSTVYNNTKQYHLFRQPTRWMKEQIISNTSQSQPTNYAFEGLDSNNDTKVVLHQIPDAVYTLDFNLIVPQDDLVSSSDTLSIPSWPVILGAYYKAVDERGEDGGSSGALTKYEAATSDAIAIDFNLFEGEDSWYSA